MVDAWLGLRVTNFEKSIDFYTSLLDLEELKRVEEPQYASILFRDRRSGLRFELNWYSDTSPFRTPYVPDAGPDHLEIEVPNVSEVVDRLRAKGIKPVTKQLWPRSVMTTDPRIDPEAVEVNERDVWITSSGDRVIYIPDPDGNVIALFDRPQKPVGGPLPVAD
jgi:catechol 2,3-dioxygenase-like lactoylglutathione lyase family enzyme